MRLVGLAAAAALVVGCGGGGKATGQRETVSDGTPSWLAEGTGAFRGDGTRKLQGVGVASGVADARARRKQADNAAREQLQSAVDALAQALAKAGDTAQDVNAVTSLLRKAAGQVATIRDHWVTPDGDERALAVVEVDALKRALQGVDGDERVRQEAFANLDRTFEQMAGAR
jgi:enamine deaminase RidA (YjgF/YER057c/UK114 family)